MDIKVGRAAIEEASKKLSNWGRWGKDDELGTANLLTDAKRKQAASLVKSGLSVSLAHNPLKEKAEDNPQPYEVTVAVPKPDAIGTGDTYRISYHGYAHSHLDALCHVFQGGKMYNARRHRSGYASRPAKGPVGGHSRTLAQVRFDQPGRDAPTGADARA